MDFRFILKFENHWRMGPACRGLSHHASCLDWHGTLGLPAICSVWVLLKPSQILPSSFSVEVLRLFTFCFMSMTLILHLSALSCCSGPSQPYSGSSPWKIWGSFTTSWASLNSVSLPAYSWVSGSTRWRLLSERAWLTANHVPLQSTHHPSFLVTSTILSVTLLIIVAWTV
jgi:hypothetical protein